MAKRERLVMGIESSCDDTGAALVTSRGRILGEALASQEEVHRAWGGVVPSLASQAHASAIDRVVDDTLHASGCALSDLDAIAVTIGPGLSLCLRVGVAKARRLAAVAQLPVMPVHHMEAHALVARLGSQRPQFPFLCLLVSGGHNLLLLCRGVGNYMQIGTTLDDAIGEAYDKTARLLRLELSPSGGPALERLALEGDSTRIPFTVPMTGVKTCDFSYSGLKNAVRLAMHTHLGDEADAGQQEHAHHSHQMRADIAASFQKAAVSQLVQRVNRGIVWARESAPNLNALVVSGGVAANKVVRGALDAVAAEADLPVYYPAPKLCTDNGVMVAWAGVERLQLGLADPPPGTADPLKGEWVDLRPRWPLTAERHPRCAPAAAVRRRKHAPNPAKQPHEALTTSTQRQLAALVDGHVPLIAERAATA